MGKLSWVAGDGVPGGLARIACEVRVGGRDLEIVGVEPAGLEGRTAVAVGDAQPETAVEVRVLARSGRRHVARAVVPGADELPESTDGHLVLVEAEGAHGGGAREVGGGAVPTPGRRRREGAPGPVSCSPGRRSLRARGARCSSSRRSHRSGSRRSRGSDSPGMRGALSAHRQLRRWWRRSRRRAPRRPIRRRAWTSRLPAMGLLYPRHRGVALVDRRVDPGRRLVCGCAIRRRGIAPTARRRGARAGGSARDSGDGGHQEDPRAATSFEPHDASLVRPLIWPSRGSRSAGGQRAERRRRGAGIRGRAHLHGVDAGRVDRQARRRSRGPRP